jgi:uncharacterized protein YndB with AHSA1/START domain
MTEVERTVDFDADADEVWDALVDDSLLEEWFGGAVDLELRPGGALRVTSGTDVREGVVEVVEPERRLHFTWTGDESRPPSTVELELEPGDSGCTLHVRESLVDDVEVVPVAPMAPAFPIGFQPPVAHRAGEALALAR